MTDKQRQIERLFKQHYRAMYKLASILLHDDELSKDMVHDVFAKLLVDNHVDVQETTARTFLLSCVRNRCLNALRAHKIQEQVKKLCMLENDVEDRTAEEIEEEIMALQSGIAALVPPICREIILLHFEQGLTFREIARQMGVSETTIYKHLRSAINQLRLTLKNHER
ncbi:MAG: sigma-70 family RNA polymerase sigma factor [Muribaculaceae bacterium]|nr:sigma-70 family RNA polymerase sigma factor [Muribaculaceae bacterium]